HRHYREHQQPHTLELYRDLIVGGAWWDHVDDIATHLVRGILVDHRVAVTPVLTEWATDEDMWVRRTSIICQVGLRGELDRTLLTQAIDANLDGSTRGTQAESTY